MIVSFQLAITVHLFNFLHEENLIYINYEYIPGHRSKIPVEKLLEPNLQLRHIYSLSPEPNFVSDPKRKLHDDEMKSDTHIAINYESFEVSTVGYEMCIVH